MKQRTFLQVKDKYQLTDTIYPYAEKTSIYRQKAFMTFIVFVVLTLVYAGLRFAGQATQIGGFLTVANYWSLLCLIALAFWPSNLATVVFTIMARSRAYERNILKNDREAKRIKKDVLAYLALDSKLQSIIDKPEEKLSEVDRKKLDAKELVEDMVVLVNTRENEKHRIIKSVMLIIENGEDSDVEKSLYELIYYSQKGQEKTFLGQQAERATGLKFGVNLAYHTGDRTYIQGFKDEGYDPYYFDEELETLRERRKNAEIPHAFPYRAGTLKGRGVERGLSDNTEINRANRQKAEKWSLEQISKVKQILDENSIGGEYNPKGFEVLSQQVKLLFVGARSFNVRDRNYYQFFQDVADRIDKECDVKGTTIQQDYTGLHVLLSLPNGRSYTGDETGIDYTQKDNLEEIFRELYG